MRPTCLPAWKRRADIFAINCCSEWASGIFRICFSRWIIPNRCEPESTNYWAEWNGVIGRRKGCRKRTRKPQRRKSLHRASTKQNERTLHARSANAAEADGKRRTRRDADAQRTGRADRESIGRDPAATALSADLARASRRRCGRFPAGVVDDLKCDGKAGGDAAFRSCACDLWNPSGGGSDTAIRGTHGWL